jgi:hypothetical protein
MKKKINVADVVKAVSKKALKPVALIELDKTGPMVHVTIPEYNSFIHLYLNDRKVGLYKLDEGKVSIQLSGSLPNEYRFRAEMLKK